MTKHLCVLSLSLFGILAVPLVLNADPVKKRTEVTFNQPVEIPGMVLEAGTYAIKIPDPVTHADMVGFYNLDETQLYKLVRTIPAYRLDVTDTTAITFEERAKDAPLAIKTWFYPGDNWGKEFVYGKAKTIAVAEAVPAPLPEAPVPAPEPAVAEVAPAPQPEAEPVAEAPEARVEIAELPLTAPLEAIPSVPIEELPKTASSMPLIALLGVSSLVLGGLLGWVVRGLAHR